MSYPLLSLLVLIFVLTQSIADPSLVRIEDGWIQGTYRGNSLAFLGIPFAAPPVGDLRWRPPQPPTPWSGVRDATQFQHNCAQSQNFDPPPGITSEDCLYLNVYTPVPTNASAQPFPVLLWIYGGGYSNGGSNETRHNGTWDILLQQDIVIVTFNYRLNAFGFLGAAILRSRSPNNSTGNYGIQDQRAAMEWVANNIAVFGGDPNNVMIYGESAGGGSVSNHLVMPASWKLFNRAVMQSGPIGADWISQSMAMAQGTYEQFLTGVGCATAPDILTCLLAVSTADVITAASNVNTGAFLAWTPVVDGVELTALPFELAAQGSFNKVPVMLGTNKDEGTVFIGYLGVDLTPAGFESWVNSEFPGIAKDVLNIYPLSNYTSPYWAASALWGDMQMTCPARRTARWLSDPELSAVPTYLYFFTHALQYTANQDPYLGCYHSSDIYFVFHVTNPYLIGTGEPALASAFVNYWTNFASSGNPNSWQGPSQRQAPSSAPYPQWPSYNISSDASLDMDIPSPYVITSNREVECDFWDSILLNKR